MKARNLHIYSDNKEWLKDIKEQYISIGFDVELFKEELVVFALNRKLKSRKQKAREAKVAKQNRSKRGKTER